ncbi:MAG: SprT protein [Fimbriimonadaceae bacterium]|jgi:predicted SprT family Zn-dependent metalloprotease|nr:SprT protein [Fimbriimonadaceae bacterium]
MPEHLEVYAAEVLQSLCRAFPMGYIPKLTWKNLRVTAGLAYYQHGEIALSRLVLTTEERVRLTLMHEYAHLLAVKRHGRKGAGHGPHWRSTMVEMGLKPVVQHDYEVRRNATKQQVVYRCVRCGSKLNRARRLPRRRQYVHARCGGSLRLETVQQVEAA